MKWVIFTGTWRLTNKQVEEDVRRAVREARHDESDITQEDYDLRHNEEVTFSDEVHAFQVNNSSVTQDTINKAAKVGLPTTHHKKYTI